MAPLTPEQRRRRGQVESVISLLAPALNVVLSAGERISKIVEPDDVDYYPPRTTHEEPPARGAPREAGES